MFYVYIVKSEKTGRYYTGYTINIERRLFEHNHNNTKSLLNNGPFSLVYSEKYEIREEAQKREREIKSYKGGNAFKKLVGRL